MLKLGEMLSGSRRTRLVELFNPSRSPCWLQFFLFRFSLVCYKVNLDIRVNNHPNRQRCIFSSSESLESRNDSCISENLFSVTEPVVDGHLYLVQMRSQYVGSI